MAKTTAQVVAAATTKLAGDISNLSTRRNHAISVFRQTAEDLGTINTQLAASVTQLDELVQFVQSERDTATKMIADNEHVRTKIFDIIGE